MLDKMLFWGGFAASARYAYKNFDTGFKKGFDYLGSAEWPRDLLANLPALQKTASNFVAGDTIEDALGIARRLAEAGRSTAFVYLPPDPIYQQDATDNRAKLVTLLARIHAADLDATINVKPSTLGLNLSADLFDDNLKDLLNDAWAYEKKIWLQAEDSSTAEQLILAYERMRAEGYDNLGISVHAQLYRTTDDIERLIALGAAIRLSKGSFAEPEYEAYGDSAETDDNYRHLMQQLLGADARSQGVSATFVTYDKDLIAATLAFASENGIDKQQFSFELPYGIGHALKASLVSEGYDVRVYLPFGTNWYAYLMQRFGEAPSNFAKFLNNAVPEPSDPLLATPE